MSGARIGTITRFHLDHLYPRFGLPEFVSVAGERDEAGARRAVGPPGGVSANARGGG
ncbi:MAG: hypothetical protein ACR2FU_25175 [Streptosporangiaceae bacterium]